MPYEPPLRYEVSKVQARPRARGFERVNSALLNLLTSLQLHCAIFAVTFSPSYIASTSILPCRVLIRIALSPFRPTTVVKRYTSPANISILCLEYFTPE